MIELSEETRSQIAKIAANADGKALVLDPADEAHRALITTLLHASGKGADRYPALHQAIAAAAGGGAPAADGSDHDASIVDLGRDSGGRATSRTWIATRGGAYISGATTVLLDAGKNEVLASGTATQVGGNLVQVSTDTATAQPATGRMTAATFFHAQATPETAPSFQMVATTVDAGTTDKEGETTKDGPFISLLAPLQSHSTGNYIVIAVARDTSHQNSDADYAYPQAQNQDPDRLVVPFQGTAILPYDTAVTQSSPIGVSTRLYVQAANAWVNPLQGFDLLGPVTATGPVVSWNYPYDGQPVAVTASIQYEAQSQANDTVTAFFYQFNVPVQNLSSPVYTFTVCSVDTPNEPSINCQTIPDLQFWWHCVAAGTLITLADGSETPVEEVDNTATVRTATGVPGAVQATSRARHTDRDGSRPVHRLLTDGGLQLFLSDGHPVVTPRGPVAARDLRPGDEVLTGVGIDRVSSCEPEPYDGIVCNLLLAEEEGRPFGSYLANGIAVGDHGAQAAHHRATRHDPDYVLPRIPETHHQDWLSALADATAR